MYLHLGSNVVVRDREILGIFDLDITSQSIRTRQFLNRAEKQGEVVPVTEELPRSFLVTGGRGHQKVYLAQLSTATLLRRSGQGGLMER